MANFLFILSQDDNEVATRCFQFAQIAHSKGHKTDLFFLVMQKAQVIKNYR